MNRQSFTIIILLLLGYFLNAQTWENPSEMDSRLYFNVDGSDPSIQYKIGRGFLINSKYQDKIEFSDGGGTTNFIIDGSGKVGIGTTVPENKLHVKGKVLFESKFGSELNLKNNSSGYTWQMVSGINGGFEIRNVNDGMVDSNAPFLISRKGNVSIGTTNQYEIYRLVVNGKIRAKEIKVETGWSDFVFENDYALPTLEEVEKHIEEKGHLKDIPSAKEVEDNGIYLGDMDAKLLQKIEELTLYTIDQEKRINKYEESLRQLKEIVVGQQKLIEKLQKEHD